MTHIYNMFVRNEDCSRRRGSNNQSGSRAEAFTFPRYRRTCIRSTTDVVRYTNIPIYMYAALIDDISTRRVCRLAKLVINIRIYIFFWTFSRVDISLRVSFCLFFILYIYISLPLRHRDVTKLVIVKHIITHTRPLYTIVVVVRNLARWEKIR